MIIRDIAADEILDSRGLPTVWARITTENGCIAEASVPSGASTGAYEALELRDNKPRLNGKGVCSAVRNIETTIAAKLCKHSFSSQAELDDALTRLDGTHNFSSLGANFLRHDRVLSFNGLRPNDEDHLGKHRTDLRDPL